MRLGVLNRGKGQTKSKESSIRIVKEKKVISCHGWILKRVWRTKILDSQGEESTIERVDEIEERKIIQSVRMEGLEIVRIMINILDICTCTYKCGHE
jgi:hypothetical protein